MPLRKIYTALIVCLLLIGNTALAATDSSRWAGYGIEANLFAGRIVKFAYNFPKIPVLSSGLDIAIVQQTRGRRDWQQRRKYPLVGLGLTFSNYGDGKLYGSCYGIYPFLQFPIVRGKKLEWTLRAGLGIGYVTKKASRVPDWDTANIVISSHLNNFTMLATDLRYRVNEHLDIQAGLSISHASNGQYRNPNLGVNLASGHIGIRYFPITSDPKKVQKELPSKKNRWLVQARMGIGFKNTALDGPIYPAYMPTIYVSKRYCNRNKAFVGLDYTYYRDMYAFYKNNEVYTNAEHKNAYEACVLIGNEFLFGHFGIVAQLNIPLHQPPAKQEKYMQKLGYNFYLLQRETGTLKELTAYVMIKANKFQADVFEYGLGVGF